MFVSITSQCLFGFVLTDSDATYRGVFGSFHSCTNLFQSIRGHDVSVIPGNGESCERRCSQVICTKAPGVFLISGVIAVLRNPDVRDFVFDTLIDRPTKPNQECEGNGQDDQEGQWVLEHEVKEGIALSWNTFFVLLLLQAIVFF